MSLLSNRGRFAFKHLRPPRGPTLSHETGEYGYQYGDGTTIQVTQGRSERMTVKSVGLFVAGTYAQIVACIVSRYVQPAWTGAIVAILVVCGSFAIFSAGKSEGEDA